MMPILQLKSLGIDDLMKFEWVMNLSVVSVLRAIEGLIVNGMIGKEARLTEVGDIANVFLYFLYTLSNKHDVWLGTSAQK